MNPFVKTIIIGFRRYRAIVESAVAVMANPPSPQMTNGRLEEPYDSPNAAATECPIEAQTALQKKASRPFTGKFAAACVPSRAAAADTYPCYTGIPRSPRHRTVSSISIGFS